MLTRTTCALNIGASVFLGLALPSMAATKAPYKNFELPKIVNSGPDGGGKLYVSERIYLKNAIRQKVSQVDAKKFLFAKEAFLAEKREEAIKLLRQQMDSGMNINRENMLLRLGQLYAEKYMDLSFQETEVFTAKLQEYEKKKAAGVKAESPKADNSRSKTYLKDSLKLFYELERKAPHHAKIDEILFFIGFVEMESGNGAKGAKYLDKVIQQHPKSRKWEEAVIYMGDYYFDKSDFKRAYAKFALLGNKSESGMKQFAIYKMAWCDLNLMRGDKALREMKRLVKDLEGEKDPAKFNLREQAIRDLVVFYGSAGSIDDAMEFFTEAVGKEKALQNLRIIADSMRSKARDAEAIRAYQRLLSETPNNPEAPLIQLGIYESLQSMDKTAKAVETLAATLDNYGPKSEWASNYSGDKAEFQNMMKVLEETGAKVAFFYHASAQKGSNKALYNHSLVLYDALIKNFPDHADRKKFLFYRAEVLYGQKKWLEAANSYMDASKIAPKDKMTDEAVYNALLALDELTSRVDKIQRFTEEEQKKVDLSPKEIPVGEARFIEIAQFYVKEYPKGSRLVDVQYRIAAIYYRYHHFDKALELFRGIALEHPKHRSAPTAAYIVLDVLNMQKNYDKLDEQAKLFASVPGLGDKKFQGEMKQISAQIGFKQVEKMEANGKWKDAGETYLALYKSDTSSPLAEKALYNALVSFEKAQEVDRAQELTRQFVAKYPKSTYTEPLLLSMAKNAEKLYEFEEAQKLYHDFYRNHSSSKEARKALFNSAVFAEILEHNGAAIDRYNDYLKSGKVSPDEQRAIQISLAKLTRKQGNWEQFGKIYHQIVKDTPKVEDKLALLGELAHQYELAGRGAAKQETVREIQALYTKLGKNAKNTGYAAGYVAEAEFNAVNGTRRKYDETVLRFPVTDLVYLVGLKQRRLKALGAAYDHVIEVGVPEWGVAALHDKADAFAAFGIGFRKVQIPAKMTGDERKETELGLKKIEADIVVSLDKQAEEMFKLCVAKAGEFQVANEYAAKCRRRAKSEQLVDSTGQLPLPNVASEFGVKWEGTIPAIDSRDYIDYLSSAVGSRDGTERRLKEFLSKNPKNLRGVYLLGLHYQKVKKLELAQYFFNQLEKESDFEWKSHLLNSLGLSALAAKNRLLAIDYFDQATKAKPPLAAAFVNRGALFLQSRSYSDAERLFRRAQEIDPSLEEAALGLGVALEGSGKFDAAHSVYSDYIGDNSRALGVLYNDSLLLGNRLGKKEAAANQMLRYIQAGGRESAKAQESMRNWR